MSNKEPRIGREKRNKDVLKRNKDAQNRKKNKGKSLSDHKELLHVLNNQGNDKKRSKRLHNNQLKR